MADNNVNKFSQADAANANTVTQAARTLTEELKDQLGIRSRLNETQKETLNLARELQRSAQENTVEIGNSGNIQKQIAKDVKISLALERELIDLRKAVAKEGSKQELAAKNIVNQTSKIRDIEQEIQGLSGQARANKLGELQNAERNLRTTLNIASADAQRLALTEQSHALSKDLLISRRKEAEIQKDINDKMGVTGALVQGVGGLMERLGMRSGIFQDAMKESAEAMRKMAEETVRGTANFSKLRIMAEGFSKLAKGFGKALFDPLTILKTVLDTYLDINRASVDLQRLTGQNAVKFENIGANAASLKDTLETISELTLRTGKNAQNIFSSKVLGQAAALKITMGLTAEEAGGIAIMAQTSGKAVDDVVDSVVATTSAFNGANRSAVSQGQVLRDVANTADSIKLSLGNNDVAIAKAAAAARRLGMDLARVDQIASSLMDFEDSIGKELEAELLTGKELNLEKARELALTNDLAGLGEELFKNSADIAEFGKMNRIQQESYAAALGMTKDELAKIAYQRALDAGMTEKQAEAAAGVEASEMKRIAAQENFAKALEKIAGAVAPILDIVGDLLSIPLAPYFILGFAAVAKLGGGLLGSVKSMGSLAKGALDFVKNLNMKGVGDFFSGLKGKFGDLKKAFGEGFAGKIQEEVADAGGGLTEKLSDKAADKAEGAADGLVDKGLDKVAGGAEQAGDKIAGTQDKLKNVKAGTGVKDFLTNLGKGLASLGKSLANGQVILGLAVLTGAIIGIGFALKLAAPGIEAFGKVISAAFSGVAELVGAVADGFVKIIGAVSMENIGPMLLLGPALFGIAAGLGAVALAGISAIPAIGGLVMLAAIAPALASIGIGGEKKSVGEAKGKSEEGGMAALEAKFDTLIELVKQGTTINLDGTKIATSVNRNLARVQVATS